MPLNKSVPNQTGWESPEKPVDRLVCLSSCRVLASPWLTPTPECRELSVSLLFQPQSGLFNSGSSLAIEKSVKTDAAEALELSEKLVCVNLSTPPFPFLSAQH